MPYQVNNTKRAKDNSGTGYSYGSAIATLSTTPFTKTTNNFMKNVRCPQKDHVAVQPKEEYHNMHILRTTAINNVTNDEPVIVMVSLLYFCFYLIIICTCNLIAHSRGGLCQSTM